MQQALHQRWVCSGHSFVPELAFHLGVGGPHAHAVQQLLSFSTAAAFVIAWARAGFTGWVAGLTFSGSLVTIEARTTFPHTAATQEKEALFTPVTLILVTVATVSIACFAFQFFSVGLLRTGFITMVFKHVIPCST